MKPKTNVLRTLNQKHVLNLYMRLFNFLLIIFGKNHGSDPDPSHWSWSSTRGNWKHQEGKRRHDAMCCCQKQTIEREDIWRDETWCNNFFFQQKHFYLMGKSRSPWVGETEAIADGLEGGIFMSLWHQLQQQEHSHYNCGSGSAFSFPHGSESRKENFSYKNRKNINWKCIQIFVNLHNL